MEKSNKYLNVLRLFLIIFFILSLRVSGEALFKIISIGKEEDYKVESEMLTKKLIKNTACGSEITKLCKDTGYLPHNFLMNLKEEYHKNFKELNEIASKHLDIEIDLTVNDNVKNYINLQLNQDFLNSKLSLKDYCMEYDFDNFYNSIDENDLI